MNVVVTPVGTQKRHYYPSIGLAKTSFQPEENGGRQCPARPRMAWWRCSSFTRQAEYMPDPVPEAYALLFTRSGAHELGPGRRAGGRRNDAGSCRRDEAV